MNLPPTLVDSQVSSVRKIIKLKLLSLLKHSASFDFQPQITTLLTDLGATQAEVCLSFFCCSFVTEGVSSGSQTSPQSADGVQTQSLVEWQRLQLEEIENQHGKLKKRGDSGLQQILLLRMTRLCSIRTIRTAV